MTTLNYETAKELKDAGFPLRYINHPHEVARYQFDDGTFAHEITLSELIEAVRQPLAIKPEGSVLQPGGEWAYEIPFDTLMFLDNQWHAGRTFVDGFDFAGIYGSGSTPEEAVARLWLSLNKKT